MSYEFLIGRRHLMSTRRNIFVSLITILSVTGVIIGVTALIIVLAVMAGFESNIKERILGFQSHIVLSRHGGEIHNYQKVVETVKNDKDVVSVLPFAMTQVMIRSSNRVSGGVVRGVKPQQARETMDIFNKIKNLENKLRCAGKNSAGNITPPGIVLGKELAGRLGVTPGDTVYLMLSMGSLTPMGHMPAMKRFEVTGIFEAGMHQFDSAFAFVHLTEAQKILHLEDTVTAIEIRIKNVYQAKTVADRIVSQLGYPFYTKNWISMNHNLFSALKLEKTVMFIILALIVLVAAFNIASSLIMIVMNKRKEIGILKAMGATRKSIKRIFVMEGLLIGGTGTIIGVVLGITTCLLLKQYEFIKLSSEVYYITTLPVYLNWTDVTAVAVAALAICYLATLYPANQASKINPVEAIRYE